MHIRELGTGTSVLLLPGSPGPAEHFAPLARVLSKNHRVLVPDLPGYGRTPPLEGTYTLARAQTAIEDGLLQRGVHALAIVGLSVGGYRALRLAFSDRVRVTHVVSLGGFAGLPAEVANQLRQYAAALRAGVDLRDVFAARMLSERYRSSHPEQVKEVINWLDISDPFVVASELEAAADGEDLRDKLRSLSIPVVARVGTLDAAVPAPFSEEIAKSAPRGRLELVEGCGHLLLLEDFEGTLASIQSTID